MNTPLLLAYYANGSMGFKGSILCLLSLGDIKVSSGHSLPFWSLILGTTLTSGQPWGSFSGSVCPNSWSIRWKHSCALFKASRVHWPTVICTQIVCKFWSNVQASVYLTIYCICFCSAEPLRLPVNMDNDITDCALIPLGSRTLSLSCTPHRCPKLWSNFWGMFPYVIVAHSTLPCFQVTFLLHGLLMEL